MATQQTEKYVKVYVGLLEPKHYQQIGPAIWEFLWLVNRITSEDNGQGLVLYGNPITCELIAGELGISPRTVRRNLKKLTDGNYIECKRWHHGFKISVNKSRKFNSSHGTKMADIERTELAGIDRTNVAGIKTDRTDVADIERTNFVNKPDRCGRSASTYNITTHNTTHDSSSKPTINKLPDPDKVPAAAYIHYCNATHLPPYVDRGIRAAVKTYEPELIAGAIRVAAQSGKSDVWDGALRILEWRKQKGDLDSLRVVKPPEEPKAQAPVKDAFDLRYAKLWEQREAEEKAKAAAQ